MRIYIYDRITRWPLLLRVASLLGAKRPNAPFSTCPKCGTERVERLRRKDEIDPVSKLPWSTVQHFLGGKLFHCQSCRLQFYDCRRQVSVSSRTSQPSHPPAATSGDSSAQFEDHSEL